MIRKNSFDIKLFSYSIFFSFLNLIIILFTEFDVLFSYLYTNILFIVLSRVLFKKKHLILNFFVLSLYIFLALILYHVLFYLMPESFGFSGPYSGIGTDDSRFYSMIASSRDHVPNYASAYKGWTHNFSFFLNFIYPFSIHHPLSIILPNLLGICYIPFFTVKVYEILVKTNENSKRLFLWVLFCPLILSNGLILMRDGWVAFLTILCVYFIVKKEIISFFIPLAILGYVRLGSAMVVAIMPLFYFSDLIFSGTKGKKLLKTTLIIIFSLVIVFYGLPLISGYLLEKGVTGIERQGFVETVIKKLDANSIIYKIYTLPLYLKLPIGFIFFLLLPFFSIDFFYKGIFNVRAIMFSTIMPILSLFYFKHFFSGFFNARKNKQDILIKRMFYLYFFSIILISQISIQPRHKISIIPIFYVLAAYGYKHIKGNQNHLSRLIVAALFFIQIFMIL